MEDLVKEVLSSLENFGEEDLSQNQANINLKFIENVEKLSSLENFQQELAACNTRIERIRLAKKYFEWIPLYPETFLKYRKNSKIACLFRENANKFYSTKKYQDALKCYNLVLTFAADEEDLAVAYANRAATLIAMKEAVAALEDINLAGSNQCPRKLVKKLDERRMKCNEMIESDKNLLTDDDSRKKCEVERERRRKFCDGILFRVKKPNPALPAAEDFVQVSVDPVRGRQLIVNRDIPAGTVLIVEEPFVSVLKNSLTWDMEHCHFCVRKIIRGVPCPSCVFVIYCDDNCRCKDLEAFHRFECPCLPLLHCQSTPRYVLLALRIVFRLGPESLFKIFTGEDKSIFFDQEEDKVSVGEEDLNANSYVPIHLLVSHASQLTPLELYSNTLNALILTEMVVNHTTFFDNIESSEKSKFVEFVASIVLLHLENVPCNSISLDEVEGLEDASLWDTHHNMSPKKLAEMVRFIQFSQYAAGVYSVSSLMNHSCDPNVTRVNNLTGGKLAVIATRSLKKNEEILTCYSRSFIKDELCRRQQYLMENYYFRCLCIACINDWPQLSEMMMSGQQSNFCCPKCSSEMYYDEKASTKFLKCVLSAKNKHKCGLCGQQYTLSNLRIELDKNIELFFQAYDLVLRNLPLDAVRSLTAPLKFFQNHVALPHSKYYTSQSVFKQALELIVYFTK